MARRSCEFAFFESVGLPAELALSRRSGILEPVLRTDHRRRLWTVQEFQLAKKVVFVAGGQTMREEDMLSTLQCHVNSKVTGVNALRLLYLHQVVDRLNGRGKMVEYALGTLVMKYSEVKCSDPRDPVYGLLGLASRMLSNGQNDQAVLQPDYSLTSKELCERSTACGIDSWKLSPWVKKAAKAEEWSG